MVDCVPFMVPTVQDQNGKIVVSLDRFINKINFYVYIKQSRLIVNFLFRPDSSKTELNVRQNGCHNGSKSEQ